MCTSRLEFWLRDVQFKINLRLINSPLGIASIVSNRYSCQWSSMLRGCMSATVDPLPPFVHLTLPRCLSAKSVDYPLFLKKKTSCGSFTNPFEEQNVEGFCFKQSLVIQKRAAFIS